VKSIWELLFELNSKTGFFKTIDTITTFQNYLIYIDVVNEFGKKGGSENYLFDLTFYATPIFLEKLNPMSASISKD
jgi:hypothetical protein